MVISRALGRDVRLVVCTVSCAEEVIFIERKAFTRNLMPYINTMSFPLFFAIS